MAVLLNPTLTGSGVLPKQDSDPITVLPLTTAASLVTPATRVTAPVTWLPNSHTRAVAPLTSTGPVTWLNDSSTRLAPRADTGPWITAAVATRPAPSATFTSPSTCAPAARQVTPSVTVSGPACTPLMVRSHTAGAAPGVTVTVTGTATTGVAGASLVTHSCARCSPSVNSVASTVTVTRWCSPGAVVPAAGVADSHGTGAAVAHAPSALTTCHVNSCPPGLPMVRDAVACSPSVTVSARSPGSTVTCGTGSTRSS